MKILFSAFLLFFLTLGPAAAEPQTLSARELAGKLGAALNSGTTDIRLRMLIQKEDQPTETLQVRIKARRAPGNSQAVYEVLWPDERKGETAFLRQSDGGTASGSLRQPDGKIRPLSASDPVLGSDLTVSDAIEDFFTWKNQSLAGSEKIGSVDCVILESKPAQAAVYARVRSWIDTRRMVPLRVEKYLPSGKLGLRIVTTRVVPDAGRQIPGDLRVENPGEGSQTLLDGSKIRHDVQFADSELNAPK